MIMQILEYMVRRGAELFDIKNRKGPLI